MCRRSGFAATTPWRRSGTPAARSGPTIRLIASSIDTPTATSIDQTAEFVAGRLRRLARHGTYRLLHRNADADRAHDHRQRIGKLRTAAVRAAGDRTSRRTPRLKQTQAIGTASHAEIPSSRGRSVCAAHAERARDADHDRPTQRIAFRRLPGRNRKPCRRCRSIDWSAGLRRAGERAIFPSAATRMCGVTTMVSRGIALLRDSSGARDTRKPLRPRSSQREAATGSAAIHCRPPFIGFDPSILGLFQRCLPLPVEPEIRQPAQERRWHPADLVLAGTACHRDLRRGSRTGRCRSW